MNVILLLLLLDYSIEKYTINTLNFYRNLINPNQVQEKIKNQNQHTIFEDHTQLFF